MSKRTLKLAEQLARTKATLSTLGMQNTPLDPRERIRQDAEYQIAKVAYEKALIEYKLHIGSMSSEELCELATTPPRRKKKQDKPNSENH